MRVRSQPVSYGSPTNLVVPQKPVWLGLIAQIDPNGGQIKPRVVWQEDPAYPTRKEQTVILFRGDAEIEFPEYKNFEFLFVTHDQNRRGGGIASLWSCDPERAPVAPPEAPAPPKQAPTLPSPESLAAVQDHEKKVRMKEEQEKALRESKKREETREKDKEESLLDTVTSTIEDEVSPADKIPSTSKSKKK